MKTGKLEQQLKISLKRKFLKQVKEAKDRKTIEAVALGLANSPTLTASAKMGLLAFALIETKGGK